MLMDLGLLQSTQLYEVSNAILTKPRVSGSLCAVNDQELSTDIPKIAQSVENHEVVCRRADRRF